MATTLGYTASSMIESLLIIFILLIFSGFFSGMEIAYLSANKMQMEIEKKSGIVGVALDKLTADPSRFITTMLVGNNIIVVIYGMVSARFITDFLPDYFQNIFWHTTLSTIIIVITAEFLPKVFFQIYANKFLNILCVPAYVIYLILSPITSFVMWISNSVLKKFFGTDDHRHSGMFTKAELSDYISGQIEKNEQDVENDVHIFQNALSFSEVKAREIMVPRTEILAIDIQDSIEDLRNMFISTKFSKILIYKDSIDEIIGYVHSFDMFKKPQYIQDVLRPIVNVPESIDISKILDVLTKRHKSIAVVIDEYGGTSGIITIEDIVEELFGEIEDEHDKVELIELQISGSEYVFSARLDVDYLNDKYKLELPENEEYETLGGMVVYFNESIPKDGDVVSVERYKFLVEDVADNKILTLRMQVVED